MFTTISLLSRNISPITAVWIQFWRALLLVSLRTGERINTIPQAIALKTPKITLHYISITHASKTQRSNSCKYTHITSRSWTSPHSNHEYRLCTMRAPSLPLYYQGAHMSSTSFYLLFQGSPQSLRFVVPPCHCGRLTYIVIKKWPINAAKGIVTLTAGDMVSCGKQGAEIIPIGGRNA